MIGLYTDDKNTLKQLCSLLDSLKVQPFVPNQKYEALIWLSSLPPPKGNTVIFPEALPLSLSEWQHLIQKHDINNVFYQNNFFRFEATHRLLINLKTKQRTALTEKETALLTFLVKAPNHQAPKEMLLQNVWQYSPDAETHTLESHLYSLKQKIGPDTDNLVYLQDGIVYLI